MFLVLYLLTLPFQLITTGSFLHQGTTALVVLTAIHAGLVAATFWTLLGNAILSTQIVEDGTLSSLIVRLLTFSSQRVTNSDTYSRSRFSSSPSLLRPPTSPWTLDWVSRLSLDRQIRW